MERDMNVCVIGRANGQVEEQDKVGRPVLACEKVKEAMFVRQSV